MLEGVARGSGQLLDRWKGLGGSPPSHRTSHHRDAQGVHQLASLLVELDPEDEASRLLAADALYRLGRLDDAHKSLLVALSRRPPAAAVLVRLALLQLRRGFSYDANQVRGPAAVAGRWALGLALQGVPDLQGPTLTPQQTLLSPSCGSAVGPPSCAFSLPRSTCSRK